MNELIGKIVVVTNLRKIPRSCGECKYYDNMGETRGYRNDGICTARGTIYTTRHIQTSKERLDNCPLRMIAPDRA